MIGREGPRVIVRDGRNSYVQVQVVVYLLLSTLWGIENCENLSS
jgi:hypothetical protein